MTTFWQKLAMRRRLIVDWQFQRSMILRAVGHSLFMLGLISFAMFLPLIEGMRSTKADGGPAPDNAAALLYMHEHFWPVALFGLAVAVVGALRSSHRVAGPLVRVKRHLMAVGDGMLPQPLRTRRRDFLKAEVEVVNGMVAGLSKRVTAVKALESELQATLRVCEERSQASGDAGLRESIAGALAQGDALHAEIDGFRFEEADGPQGAVCAPAIPQPQVLGG